MSNELGGCYHKQGKLELAEATYQEAIRFCERINDLRGIAITKNKLSWCKLDLNMPSEALRLSNDALAIFDEIKDASGAASSWHYIGMCYGSLGCLSESESAYKEAMKIHSKIGDRSGEAADYGDLGNLYVEQGRIEEALKCFRNSSIIFEAIDADFQEGISRANSGACLLMLERIDEARPELLRAIECKQAFGHAAELWKTWSIFYDLEQASGNLQAAREAWQKAFVTYLAYRRDGGENHESVGRLCVEVGQAIQQGDMRKATQIIEPLLQNDDWPKNFLHKLQSIIFGKHDMTVAGDENLHYKDAVELILLLEGLEAQ